MKRFVEWLRSWRLLSLRSAVVAVLVLYALVGFVVVPVVAKKLIVDIARERTGREVTLEAVRCNPFALSLTVRGLSVPDRDGQDLLRLDSLYVNAQLSSLFRWAATLKELRLENPYVGLRRFADGRINVQELLEEIEQRAPAGDEIDDLEAEQSFDLPRVVLQHILVTGATVDLEDHDRDEPLKLTYGPSVFELHDISTLPDRKGDNAFTIGLQRGGTIKVAGEVVLEPLGLAGTVSVDKIFLENAWPILEPYFEFDIVGGDAMGQFDYEVRPGDEGLHVRIHNLDYDLAGLQVEPRDSDVKVLELHELQIEDGHFSWPEGDVGAAQVTIDGAGAFTWLEADGSFGWEALVPKATQVQVVDTYEKVEKALPWKATVGRFEVRGAHARFEDRTFDEPLTFSASDANLVLTDVTTEHGVQWGIETSAKLPGGAIATAEGEFGLGPTHLEASVGVQGLDLSLVEPYLARFAPIDLAAGSVEASGTIRVSLKGEGPMVSFAGDAAVDGFDLRETAVGSRLLHWDRVEVQGIEAAHQPQSLKVAGIDIRGAGFEVVVAEDQRINLVELIAAVTGQNEFADSETADIGESPEPSSADADNEGGIPPIEIGVVTLHDCSGTYTDRTLTPPFTLALTPIDGTVEAISTEATAGADVEIEGVVQSGGSFAIKGEIDLLDPGRLTDLQLDVREAELPPLSPMALRYLGHPVEQGRADVGLDYEVLANQLTGENRIVTHDLELGDEVEAEGAIDLPVKLGVSLLTDKNGRIEIDFPVEGRFDDPDFGLGNAIDSAVKDVMGSLVKSPFRLLAKLGGGKEGDDYGYVEFAAGSAELGATSETKLRTLAAGVDQRPELILVVAGVWEPEVDTVALQEASFENLLADQVDDASGVTDTGEPTSRLHKLESVYRELSLPEGLEQLRAQFTTEGEVAGDAPVFDETAYYRDLRRLLIEALPIDEADLRELASARAETIRTLLVDEVGVDAGRVKIVDPVEVKPTGEAWVQVELDVTAE